MSELGQIRAPTACSLTCPGVSAPPQIARPTSILPTNLGVCPLLAALGLRSGLRQARLTPIAPANQQGAGVGRLACGARISGVGQGRGPRRPNLGAFRVDLFAWSISTRHWPTFAVIGVHQHHACTSATKAGQATTSTTASQQHARCVRDERGVPPGPPVPHMAQKVL